MSARSRVNPWFGPRRKPLPLEREEHTLDLIPSTSINLDLTRYYAAEIERPYTTRIKLRGDCVVSDFSNECCVRGSRGCNVEHDSSSANIHAHIREDLVKAGRQ